MKIPGCSSINTVNKKSAWVLITILAKIREDSHYSPPRRKLNSFEFSHDAFRNVRLKCKLCSNSNVTEVVNPVYEDYERMLKQLIHLDYRSNLEQTYASVLSLKYINRTQQYGFGAKRYVAGEAREDAFNTNLMHKLIV